MNAPCEPADCPSPSSPGASSSSAAGAFSFSTSGQRTPSTSTSAPCFGAGGAGMRLWISSKALARASKIHAEADAQQAAAPEASVAPKGYAVGRHLRRISRRLRQARASNKETPAAPPSKGAAVDDTARERAEAVASAIAHFKETLRRGTPLSSLSLDLRLCDRQDEIIAGAAALYDDECSGCSRRSPPAADDAPCTRLPYIQGGRRYESAVAPAAATGTPPSQVNGVASWETETPGGFGELEFLETFDGDEELIETHFITVQI